MDNFYINASFMKSVIDNEVYAAFAQAPVLKVIEHFWYACYHYNIPKIVMLCALEDPHRGVIDFSPRYKQKNTGLPCMKKSPSQQSTLAFVVKLKTPQTQTTSELKL